MNNAPTAAGEDCILASLERPSNYRLYYKGASEGTERNRTYSGFGGRVGLDVELSPAVSVRGGFGVSFTDFDKGTERNRASFDFGGHVGLDVELSPAISVRGGFGVSFTDFDSGFRIGLNFH